LGHPPHSHVVLVVEDYDDLRDALEYELRAEGFGVRAVASGREALGLLAQRYRPCLLLLDVQMPDVDGWDVCRAVRADPDTAHIPIVLLTGDSHALGGGTRGVAHVLAKPVLPGELVATINEHARCPCEPASQGLESR
jgi:CheY-like chemotaxis protein